MTTGRDDSHRIDLVDDEAAYPPDLTLDQWAEICWPMLVSSGQIRAGRGINDYKFKYKNRIGPYIGHVEVRHLTRRYVQAWVNAQKPGPKSRPTTTQASLVKSNYIVLLTLIREAVTAGLLEINPCDKSVKRPKHQPIDRPFVPIPILQAMDWSRYPQILELVMFLAHHGLRWGEYRALTEEDFITSADGKDWVRVSKSHDDITKSGRVRLVPYMKAYPWRPDMIRNRQWFYNRLRQITSDSLTEAARKAEEAAGKAVQDVTVAGLCIHSLRHSYCYWLKATGVPIDVAQQYMGHEDVKLTLALYGKVLPDNLAAGATILLDSLPDSSDLPSKGAGDLTTE